MRTRTVLAAVVGVALAANGAAYAATKPKPKPKPLCNLVTDKAADVATGAKSLDIVSADVVTDGKLVTAVIRLAKLAAPASDTASPTGGFYQLQFTFNGAGYVLHAHVTPAGTSYGPAGKGKGTFDLAKNEVRIHVATADMPGAPVLKPGALLTDLVARTDVGNPQWDGGSTLHIAGDLAQGFKPYPVGHPSCVRLGA